MPDVSITSNEARIEKDPPSQAATEASQEYTQSSTNRMRYWSTPYVYFQRLHHLWYIYVFFVGFRKYPPPCQLSTLASTDCSRAISFWLVDKGAMTVVISMGLLSLGALMLRQRGWERTAMAVRIGTAAMQWCFIGLLNYWAIMKPSTCRWIVAASLNLLHVINNSALLYSRAKRHEGAPFVAQQEGYGQLILSVWARPAEDYFMFSRGDQTSRSEERKEKEGELQV